MLVSRRCVVAKYALLLISLHHAAAFSTQFLNGTWIANSDTHQNINAQVPGGIYTDLMRNEVIPDVFLEYGDVDYRWVGNKTWIYTRIFDAEAAILQHSQTMLIFEGVDTFATIHLNSKLIGTTDNMFVRYEFPINTLLKERNNELVVTFESSITKAKDLYDKQAQNYPVPPKCVPGIYNGECHVNHIRKMQASFAWDWGPAFPSMGLWKNVYINAYNATYIKDVAVEVRPDGDDYKFTVTLYMMASRNSMEELNGVLRFELGTKYSVDVLYFDVTRVKSSNDDHEFVIVKEFSLPHSKFDLWWPNGYGAQSLYPLKVTMTSDAGETVSKSIRYGIRQVELVQKPIGNGLSFYFKINGLPIFAKGSNMVPSHILPEHSNNATLIKKLMRSAKDVHMNMIRVWGGGLYEADLLYEIADEMGIMIWQDFMFACSMYPTNSEFLLSVEREVEHQVRRLQHHPSIVLWAGNNENEAALTGNWYGTSSNRTVYDADYRQLYGKTIRDVVLKNDPSRKYLSSSPTNGLKSEEDDYISPYPGDNRYGDVHFYNYIFDSWDINIYPVPRFASEYGYQALPSYNSMQTTIAGPENMFIDSKFMNHRQHHPLGNIELPHLIGVRLELPPKANNEKYNRAFFFYTQITQAMAIKIETEHYRQWQSYLDTSGNGMTMGALYWQLNCPWLAPTWSGVESTGKWKMLHYFAKVFFAPIIVTSHQHPNHTVGLYVVSDQPAPIFNATLKITIFKWNSLSPVNEKIRQVDAVRMGSLRLTKINMLFFVSRNEQCNPNGSDCFVRLTLEKENKSIAPEHYIYPIALKNSAIPFANVHISYVQRLTPNKIRVVVETDLPAVFVWLESSFSGIFSENGFTMVQQEKEIEFESDDPLSLKELHNSLRVTHLRDKFYFS